MSIPDDSILAKTYDCFRDFVHSELRVGDNKYIDTRAYGELNVRLHNPSHMAINLEHVIQGNEHLFSTVKKFDKESKIIQRDKIEDTGSNYIAYVPYVMERNNNNNNKNKLKRRWGGTSSGKPNTNILFLYFTLLIVIFIIGVVKTNRSDWKFLF